MTLSIEEFLGRLLLHVPLPGMQVVRGYGLYSRTDKDNLELCRSQLPCAAATEGSLPAKVCVRSPSGRSLSIAALCADGRWSEERSWRARGFLRLRRVWSELAQSGCRDRALGHLGRKCFLSKEPLSDEGLRIRNWFYGKMHTSQLTLLSYPFYLPESPVVSRTRLL